MTQYNKTQLNPEQTFEKHVYHRDQFGHYLRWTHVLKIAKIGSKILDFGCGSGNLLEVLYRNRYKASNYLGLDVRKQTIDKANEKYLKIDWAEFRCLDLCSELDVGNDWDVIACFEVIEHIGKQNADKFLQNIAKCMHHNTILLLSTPNYDENIGAANNHMINGEVGEFTFEEMRLLLMKYFDIVDAFGVFASQRDYKERMNEWQKKFFVEASEYFDSNILSNLMAPIMSPELSRNIMWRCKLK